MQSKFDKILRNSHDFYASAKRDKGPNRLRKIAEALHTVVPEEASLGEPARGVIYIDSDFDAEFEEAKRYPEFQSKEDWFKAALKGRVVPWSELGHVNNHSDDIDSLDPEKKERVETSILRDKVEYPIVGKWPSGELEMIAGNTRVAMLKHMGHDPMIWLIDVPFKKASKSYFFKKLAQSMVSSKEPLSKVYLSPLAKNIKNILIKDAVEKDLEEWETINDNFLGPLNYAASILYKGSEFFILSNHLNGNDQDIYAISTSRQNKQDIVKLVNSDHFARTFASEQGKINFVLSEEVLLKSFKSVPNLFVFKFKEAKVPTKSNSDVAVESGNKWIDYILNATDIFIDEEDPSRHYTNSDILKFVQQNKSQLQRIKSNFGALMPAIIEQNKNLNLSSKIEEPIELGSGLDGIAFDIGGQKVLKVFKSKYAFDALKKSEDLMHLVPDIGKTEMMIYDMGELSYNGKTAYYSIIPKVETFPSLDLGALEFGESDEGFEPNNLFKKCILDNKNISRKNLRILFQRKKDIEEALAACENGKFSLEGKEYTLEDFLKMDADNLMSVVDEWKYKKSMFKLGVHITYIKARIADIINSNIQEINKLKGPFKESKFLGKMSAELSAKIDGFVDNITKIILKDPRLSSRIKAINETQKLVPNWAEDFVREMLTRHLTGRDDLHMANLGIDKGRLRHFDPAYMGDSDEINYQDKTLKN